MFLGRSWNVALMFFVYAKASSEFCVLTASIGIKCSDEQSLLLLPYKLVFTIELSHSNDSVHSESWHVGCFLFNDIVIYSCPGSNVMSKITPSTTRPGVPSRASKSDKLDYRGASLVLTIEFKFIRTM